MSAGSWGTILCGWSQRRGGAGHGPGAPEDQQGGPDGWEERWGQLRGPVRGLWLYLEEDGSHGGCKHGREAPMLVFFKALSCCPVEKNLTADRSGIGEAVGRKDPGCG